MSKANLGGRDMEVSPLNLKVIRRLMSSGTFDKLQKMTELSQEQQLDVMVAFVAASTGVDEDFFWENLGMDDIAKLPDVFNQVLLNSGFVGKSEKGEGVSH